MIHEIDWEARTQPRPWPAAQPARVTPLGQIVRVDNDRAPFDVHLMALVSAARARLGHGGPDQSWEGFAPLAALLPDTLELEVTGPSARLRAVVPVRAGQERAQKGGH